MAVERRHHGHGGHSLHDSAATAKARNSRAKNKPLSPSEQPRHKRMQRTRRHWSSWGRPAMGIWSSRALLLFVAFVYATNFACIRYLEVASGSTVHDPAEIAFCRFFVSACVCLPILYANRGNGNSEIMKAGMEVGFWVSIHYICQAESLEYISAGKCSFICALEVVTVPLIGRFFLKTAIRPQQMIAALVALFGVGILEGLIHLPGTNQSAIGPTSFGIGKGDVLALGQPFFFGYAMMKTEHYLEKFSDVPSRVLTITAAQCTTVLVMTTFWLLYDNGGSFPDLSYMLETRHILTICWTGMITTVFCIMLQGIALQKASAVDAALIFSSDPVWSSLFAGWLLGEMPSLATFIGGAFIIAACVIGSVSSARDAADTDRSQRPGRTPSQHGKLKHRDSNESIHMGDEESLLPDL